MAKGKKTGGRRKGTPNAATANARQAIALFVDGNAHRLQEWLDEVYSESGAQAALDCFNKLLEFHVPKLARTEVTGRDGGALEVQIVRYSIAESVGPKAIPDAGVAEAGTGVPPRRTPLAPTVREG